MKFLQVHSYSDEYLRDLSLRHPEMEVATYGANMRILRDDGQSAAHLLASHLDPNEFESRLLVPNFQEGLASWKRESGIRPSVRGNDLLVEHVREFSPEILYLSTPERTGVELIQSLPKRPRLVIGRFSTAVTSDFDWSEFDLLVSDEAVSSAISGRFSSRPFERLPPGYPTGPCESLPSEEEEIDLVFFGRSIEAHRDRNRSFLETAKATLSQPRDFLVECYLATPHPGLVPAGIAMFNHGPRFGREAHRALKRGRICLDVFLPCDGDEFGALEAVEGAAFGSFQLLRHSDSIVEHFEAGEEVETYRSQEELLEKLFFYLDHPESRRAVSERARQRCLRSYSMDQRAQKFQEIALHAVKKCRGRMDTPLAASRIDPVRSMGTKSHRKQKARPAKGFRGEQSLHVDSPGLIHKLVRQARKIGRLLLGKRRR